MMKIIITDTYFNTASHVVEAMKVVKYLIDTSQLFCCVQLLIHDKEQTVPKSQLGIKLQVPIFLKTFLVFLLPIFLKK